MIQANKLQAYAIGRCLFMELERSVTVTLSSMMFAKCSTSKELFSKQPFTFNWNIKTLH